MFMQKKKEAINEERENKNGPGNYQETKVTASHETIGNITILNIGKRTWVSQFLKSMRDA